MRQLIQILFMISLLLPGLCFAAEGKDIPVYTELNTNVTATAGQSQFIIKLKSNPTTGYSWFLREYDARYISPVKHEFQAAENRKLMGALGFEVWTFELQPAAFTVPLQTSLSFVYARPWEKNEQANSLTFLISTVGNKPDK